MSFGNHHMKKKSNKKPQYKSGLERNTHALIPEAEYEPDRLAYTVVHKYTPDFKIGPKTYIEAKGRFLAQDRAKHLHIKAQHPEITIHFLFGKSSNTLSRASKTTYADWCEKYGFQYSDITKGIPKEWLKAK